MIINDIAQVFPLFWTGVPLALMVETAQVEIVDNDGALVKDNDGAQIIDND